MILIRNFYIKEKFLKCTFQMQVCQSSEKVKTEKGTIRDIHFIQHKQATEFEFRWNLWIYRYVTEKINL